MSKLKKLNNEISTLLCQDNSEENNLKKKNINKTTVSHNLQTMPEIVNNVFEEFINKTGSKNNEITVVNTNLEQFINEKLSGNKTNNRGFYKNGIFNKNKLNAQLKKDLSRQWDDIEIGNFRVKNNQKTILQNNNNNKKEKVSKYTFNLVNTKLNNFLSSFTMNEELLKKYRINIKLFLQQSSQADVYLYILQILKISSVSILFLKPNFNKVETKIYKDNNSILTTNIYKYDISTGSFKNNNNEYEINIGSATFIYYCNHTQNKLKGTIQFNWEKENIRNFMNMIIKYKIDENIMDKLYEKIFCKKQNTNMFGEKSCGSFYNTIEDIDTKFEYYYNLLKNKNLTKITEQNLTKITEQNLTKITENSLPKNTKKSTVQANSQSKLQFLWSFVKIITG